MQDGRGLDFVKLIKLYAQRPGGKIQRCGNFHEPAQRRAAHGYQMAPAQDIEVNIVSMIACNHCHTGQAAFRHFSLQDNRQGFARKQTHLSVFRAA